ncbi:bacteriophage protein [Yersinia bercovieri]|uniref:tail fiber assembly protein n=1 Tax=Yersinia bercovieri TaxID=634 RepID=UPI00061BF9AE|nr:tail assembly chaperone [Yersinia bercovieri]CNF13659.1 bacteriophage protein [Yersinia bercovieri]
MGTLQHYKNFVILKQEYDAELNGVVIFHVDEEGRDWYELQQTFREDTIKIGYNAEGLVCTASQHVYALCPTGLSIVEVESLPDDFILEYGAYEYVDGEVIRHIPSNGEIMIASDERRKQLMSEISVELATLQDVADSNDATERELSRLAALKAYRLALYRLDVSQSWPTLPPK